MSGFMADFDADLARPFGVGAVGATATITGYANGFVTGLAAPNSLVVLTANGAYAGSGYSNASGGFSIAPTTYGQSAVGAGCPAAGQFQVNLYSAFNPNDMSAGQSLSNGYNTVTDTVGGAYKSIRGALGRSAGKWYFELSPLVIGATNYIAGGILAAGQALNTQLGMQSYCASLRPDGYYYSNGNASSQGWTYKVGDVVNFAVDLDRNYIYFGKNGTYFNNGKPTSGTGGIQLSGSMTYYPSCNTYNASDAYTLNTGSSAFQSQPPSGYLPWG